MVLFYHLFAGQCFSLCLEICDSRQQVEDWTLAKSRGEKEYQCRIMNELNSLSNLQEKLAMIRFIDNLWTHSLIGGCIDHVIQGLHDVPLEERQKAVDDILNKLPKSPASVSAQDILNIIETRGKEKE